MATQFVPISKLLNSAQDQDRPVALRADKVVTWAKFYSAVGNLAATLAQDPAIEWVLSCQDSLYFAEGLLALLYANKTVLLPHNIQTETLNSIATGKTKILSDTVLHNTPVPVLLITAEQIVNTTIKLQDLDAANITLKMFTSGSTGNPKLVLKKLSMLEAEISELEKGWGKELPDSVFFSTVVHQHIYGLLFRILWPLCRGSMFATHLITTPEELIPLYKKFKSIALISSPAYLKRLQLLETKDIFTEHKFHVFSSGGLLQLDTSQEMQRIFGTNPMEVLGSTETGGVAYRTQKEHNAAWTPFSVVQLKLDPDGQLLLTPRQWVTLQSS